MTGWHRRSLQHDREVWHGRRGVADRWAGTARTQVRAQVPHRTSSRAACAGAGSPSASRAAWTSCALCRHSVSRQDQHQNAALLTNTGYLLCRHAPPAWKIPKKTCLEGDRDLDLLLRFSFLSLSRSLSFDFLQIHCKPWSQHVAKVTGDDNMSS
jgi:hypothetical protein